MKVRALFLIIASVLAVAKPVSAQYKLHRLSVSSGQDAIASGITGIARFTNGRNIAEFAAQPEQAWFIYGAKRDGRVSVVLGGSVGHFQEAPYVGPYLTADASLGRAVGVPVSVGAIFWPAFFAWEPKKWKNDGVENTEPLYLGAFGGVGASFGPVGLSYHLLNFMDDPWNELPGVRVTLPVRSDLTVGGSMTRNTNAKKWMLWMGITWSPK